MTAQLSDPVYAKRVGATRRLCAIGTPAMESLGRAAASDDMEAALRARKVLKVLERVYFGGVEVRLESDRASFEWDEPIEVRMILENRSHYAARIPFLTGTDQSDSDSADARQVASMVDASDWLVVQNAQGREVELRVDEISDDPAVLRVIQDRLAGGPVSRMEPGQRASVTLTAFNRGWARYPMLDEGAHTVSFRYVPEWIDPVLAEQRVGEVRSNTLTLRISKAAPESISRRGAQAELTLQRDQNDLVASLTNHSDRMMLINTNYGVSAPFAVMQWAYDRDGRRSVVAASAESGRNWSDFAASRFVPLDAGRSLELARTSIADLERALGRSGELAPVADAAISVSYFNLCDRQWQMREQANLDKDESAPAVLKSTLPRQLLSARLTSQSLRPWSTP